MSDIVLSPSLPFDSKGKKMSELKTLMAHLRGTDNGLPFNLETPNKSVIAPLLALPLVEQEKLRDEHPKLLDAWRASQIVKNELDRIKSRQMLNMHQQQLYMRCLVEIQGPSQAMASIALA